MNAYLQVLVVEDWEDDMLLVLRQLRRGGYKVDALRVETAEQMQAALDRQPWDLIVADYTLPEFSALEALKLLQRHSQDLPFIIVSGTISEETAVAAMKAGAHDYITKGNLARLVPAVERELREAGERQKRHEAERALRESEERFRQLAENVSEIVFWMSDLQTDRLLYVSPAYERIWGRSCESLYANGREWLEGIHPEDRQRVRQNFDDRALAGGYDEEYRVLRLDGSVCWVRDRGFPLGDADGKPYRVVGIAQDITDLKQAELTLRQQIQQEYLLADIAQDIRQSLDLHEVLSRTVERVRELLNTDRVVLFQFRPDWQGDVIMESVGVEWMPILSTTISDPCFRDRYIEPYRQGRSTALTDINAKGIQPCYAQLLQQFQVRANLVVPIVPNEHLWGLLIAHHCAAPRQWQPVEIALLQRLATQVGIAIKQSELYEQTRQELLERQRMQAVLEESEERFRTLNAAAPIGICQTNADGFCLYTNDRWQQISGLSFEDCLGNGWLQGVHPNDRQTIQSRWEAYLRGENEFLTEFRLLTPQGKIHWVSARVGRMQSASGEIIGYVKTYEEITDRKLSEEKIREQAALLDIASDAIFVRDLEHRILYWNSGAQKLYGWSAEEAIGQKANELLREDASTLSDIIQVLQVQGEWRGEIHNATRMGKEAIVQGRWTLVSDEVGQPQFILSVNTDITEKKLLEAQFYQAQRLESLGTLASGIAHDLNNVLAPILTLAQIMGLQKPPLDDRSLKRLNMIEEATKRGAKLVKQILTFVRGSEGERVLLSVVPQIQEAIEVLQQTFPKSIEIRQQLPDSSLWQICADPTHIHQILLNLCINARDAMPHGGVLTLSAENYAVDELSAQRHLNARAGNYVLVTVSDTGTGILPEVRDRIFEPFFTTKPPGCGTGLGLSTVLGIVKSMGGFLQVSSEMELGTQFKVYLPATEETAVKDAREPKTLQGNGELVLIVEDEPVLQTTTQLLLEHYGYTTIVASDGIEAIALFAQNQERIKVVSIDIIMPNMDGMTAIRTLHKINPHIPLVAVSGFSGNRESLLDAGAKAFLAKPYIAEDLLRIVGNFARSMD